MNQVFGVLLEKVPRSNGVPKIVSELITYLTEKEARKLIKASQSGRLFMLFAVALIGHLVPVFNLVAVVIPFIFPRFAVMLRPMFNKKG